MADGWLMLLMIPLLLAMCGCDERTADGQVQTQAVKIGDRTFNLELALDDASRYRGLSDRQSLPDDGGMLFVFPKPRPLQFVMRDCLFPIDILFLDGGGRVVAMHEMKLEPYGTPDWRLPHYSSRYPAQFAIEVKGGTIATLGVKVGDKVPLPLEKLKAAAQ